MTDSKTHSRGILIAGNWKMNHSRADTQNFLKQYLKESSALKNPKVSAWIYPSFTSLTSALEATQGSSVKIGAQNAHWEEKGAFTGEISASMLKDIGIHHALVGHSERRQFFGETDETVRKRAETLLRHDFHVILCIGETQAQREAGETHAVIQRQLKGAIPDPQSGVATFLTTGKLILAYEPVWAIGTGLTATPAQAEEAHALIRKELLTRFGAGAADRTPVLYGGSVKPDNIHELLKCPNIDGALVGGASLKATDFLALVKAAHEVL